MSDEKFTRCPACKTTFRVTPQQLAMREGQVRCGHCRTAFDGVAAQISLAPRAAPAPHREFEVQDFAPATMTLRSAQALEAVSEEDEAAGAGVAGSEPPDEGPEGVSRERADEAVNAFPDGTAGEHRDGAADRRPDGAIEEHPDGAVEERPDEAAEVPVGEAGKDGADGEVSGESVDQEAKDSEVSYASRFAWQDERRRRRIPAWVFAVTVPLLVLLLAGQAAFHFKDAIAARWPGVKPALSSVCGVIGCRVRASQDVAALSIESSDLQVDPAHKGLLVLTAGLRNRAAYAMAYPYVELTLTDTQDHVVVRRAFAPQEYASGSADLESGIAGNSELNLKLFIDASSTSQAGYQIYLFYP